MGTVFRDSQGVFYIDYLEKGKTVTGLYYAESLGRSDKASFGEEKSALPS